MSWLRSYFLHHRSMAFMLIFAALCMKAFVPSGYMVGTSDKIITIQLCQDGLGQVVTQQISIPMHSDLADSMAKADKGDCAFSSLSMAAMGADHVPMLAAALAFIMAVGLAPSTAPSLKRIFHLRPPLRGPPAYI